MCACLRCPSRGIRANNLNNMLHNLSEPPAVRKHAEPWPALARTAGKVELYFMTQRARATQRPTPRSVASGLACAVRGGKRVSFLKLWPSALPLLPSVHRKRQARTLRCATRLLVSQWPCMLLLGAEGKRKIRIVMEREVVLRPSVCVCSEGYLVRVRVLHKMMATDAGA